MKVFLLVTLVTTLLCYIDGSSFGDHLLARLSSDVCHMDNLILLVQQYYRDEKKYHLDLNPKYYEDTLNCATSTIGRARRLIGDIETGGQSRAINQGDKKNQISFQDGTNNIPMTRRSNGGLQFKTNFYKALSRALKQEFPDDSLIQEHVHDGFVPPTTLNKRVDRNFAG